ncbi:MAG: bifunctional metallophosphatase/5'-nucleotidase [Lactobacillales bacterium]|jgi:2',3'-cyclic-nucleotide 2'-phosphodiesterase/3'-nucleotidase|nr:bifunctional metallophosphatase/5'-nucleotidase [Lactobacillales bacterium]
MKELKIYYTSDTHGYLYPTDYADDAPKELGLMNTIYNFEKDGNTLIIDGGDIFQGSPYINYFQKKGQVDQGIAETMNAGGYDFITLGNHDFNYGFPRLEENLKLLNAQVTAVNVLSKDGKQLFPAQIKVLENGLRVGIVGFTTDYINIWEAPVHIDRLQITDTFEAAKKALVEIKDQVDFTIGLYHGGFEADIETEEIVSKTSENIGYKLAKELDFDLLLTGHQHATIPGRDLFGTYIVQPTNMAKNYFEIHVAVDEHVTLIESELRTPGTKHSQALYDQFYPLEKEVQHYLNQPVGHLAQPIPKPTHLALATHGNDWIELIGHVQKLQTEADIAVVSSFNVLKDIKQDVSIRDLLISYPFENTLYKLELTGKQLKNVMEKSAEYFALKDNEIVINPLWLSPKTEHYNYDFYLGVSYLMDISRPVGDRIVDLMFHDLPVKEDDTFTVAVNNYRAFGGGNYLDYADAKVLESGATEIQQLLIDYVSSSHEVYIPKELAFGVI